MTNPSNDPTPHRPSDFPFSPPRRAAEIVVDGSTQYWPEDKAADGRRLSDELISRMDLARIVLQSRTSVDLTECHVRVKSHGAESPEYCVWHGAKGDEAPGILLHPINRMTDARGPNAMLSVLNIVGIHGLAHYVDSLIRLPHDQLASSTALNQEKTKPESPLAELEGLVDNRSLSFSLRYAVDYNFRETFVDGIAHNIGKNHVVPADISLKENERIARMVKGFVDVHENQRVGSLFSFGAKTMFGVSPMQLVQSIRHLYVCDRLLEDALSLGIDQELIEKLSKTKEIFHRVVDEGVTLCASLQSVGSGEERVKNMQTFSKTIYQAFESAFQSGYELSLSPNEN